MPDGLNAFSLSVLPALGWWGERGQALGVGCRGILIKAATISYFGLPASVVFPALRHVMRIPGHWKERGPRLRSFLTMPSPCSPEAAGLCVELWQENRPDLCS